MMKRYVKQKVKHKMKLYSTCVSVRQMKEQHDETKCSVKRRKKKIITNDDDEDGPDNANALSRP